ncbi:unnamed protein product, partial [Ectocarpus sp. 8 AP-2014]
IEGRYPLSCGLCLTFERLANGVSTASWRSVFERYTDISFVFCLSLGPLELGDPDACMTLACSVGIYGPLLSIARPLQDNLLGVVLFRLPVLQLCLLWAQLSPCIFTGV